MTLFSLIPVVMEPVVDAPCLYAKLLGQILHCLGAGVRVQEEGDVESLPLLLGDCDPSLLGGAARLRGGVAVVI